MARLVALCALLVGHVNGLVPHNPQSSLATATTTSTAAATPASSSSSTTTTTATATAAAATAAAATSSTSASATLVGSPRWRKLKTVRRVLRQQVHARGAQQRRVLRSWSPTVASWAATATTLELQARFTDPARLQEDAAAVWGFIGATLDGDGQGFGSQTSYFGGGQGGLFGGATGLVPSHSLMDFVAQQQDPATTQLATLYAFMWINIVAFLWAMPVIFPPKRSAEVDSNGQHRPIEVPRRRSPSAHRRAAAGSTAASSHESKLAANADADADAPNVATATDVDPAAAAAMAATAAVPTASLPSPHKLTAVDYSFIVLNTLCMPGFFYHFLVLLRDWGGSNFDVFASLAALPPAGATPQLPPLSAIPAAAASAAAALPSSLAHATAPVDGALAAAEAVAVEAVAACSEALPQFAGSLLLYFSAYELVYYYWHRALHEVPVLYRWVHKHHHQQTYPCRPALDTLNTGGIESGVGSYLQLAVLWLCGEGLGVANAPAALAFFEIAGWLSVLEHDKYERALPFGFWRADEHHMHHAFVKCNYGPYTTFWDRVYGTFRPFELRPHRLAPHPPPLPPPLPSQQQQQQQAAQQSITSTALGTPPSPPSQSPSPGAALE